MPLGAHSFHCGQPGGEWTRTPSRQENRMYYLLTLLGTFAQGSTPRRTEPSGVLELALVLFCCCAAACRNQYEAAVGSDLARALKENTAHHTKTVTVGQVNFIQCPSPRRWGCILNRRTHTHTYIYHISAGPFRGHQAARHSVQVTVSKSLQSFNHKLTVRFYSPSLQLSVCRSGICF